MKEFIDSAASKHSATYDIGKKSWHEEMKNVKNDTLSTKIKVINVIQDVGVLGFLKVAARNRLS